MKTVAKLIIGLRVIVGLCKLMNTAVPEKTPPQYAVLVRWSVCRIARPIINW